MDYLEYSVKDIILSTIDSVNKICLTSRRELFEDKKEADMFRTRFLLGLEVVAMFFAQWFVVRTNLDPVFIMILSVFF